jgi:LacI family transcriptional regulator
MCHGTEVSRESRKMPAGAPKTGGAVGNGGERPLTSRDVAALAGVSQTTVSRVLSGSGAVSEGTRSRVMAVLEQTGYMPNSAARVMRTRSSGILGVVVGRVTSPFYPQLLDRLADAIAARGKLMSLWISDGAEELGALDAIKHGTVDGVLYTTATRDSRSLWLALRQGAPVVLVNRTLARVRCDQVSTDSRRGGAALARHLLDGGRRRIGVIGGPRDTSVGREREDGFLAELVRAGRPLDERLRTRGAFSHRDGYRGMGELLERRPAPDAVFCVNDVIAMGATDAARALGVRVPDDVWIVGFDDLDMAGWESYSLTTVRQPMEEMAERAVTFLLERIEGRAPERFRHARLRGELIVRGSTGGEAS